MLVVSDTSTITNLVKVERLDLLKHLFNEVIIPQKVYDELTNYELNIDIIKNSNWIKVKKVTPSKTLEELKTILDEGEAEAIILAKDIQASYLIIDELKGRKIAEQIGLKITGLIGILLKCKEKGIVTNVKTILDQLINDFSFRIRPTLYQQILSKANEK